MEMQAERIRELEGALLKRQDPQTRGAINAVMSDKRETEFNPSIGDTPYGASRVSDPKVKAAQRGINQVYSHLLDNGQMKAPDFIPNTLSGEPHDRLSRIEHELALAMERIAQLESKLA